MNKKKIIIISSSVIVLLLIILVIIFLIGKNESKSNIKSGHTENFVPDILNVEEKTKLGIPKDVQIQAMKRDENGAVTIYKIIKSDADIVNPEKVESINPQDMKR